MAFKTFTVGEVLTAADVNTMLMKQAVIVCTSGTRPASPTEGMFIYETDTDRVFVYTGAFWIAIIRPTELNVNAAETTASTTYTDLATSGPAVTIDTNTQVELSISSFLDNDTAASDSWMGFAVSGATTLAAADGTAIMNRGVDQLMAGRTILVAGLTPGSNTFTAKYRVSAGTGTFSNRRLKVRAV